LANLWGSVVVSLLFWGFANEITTVDEVRREREREKREEGAVCAAG
jgi:hypothetical protein